jgi:hypothetical protein
MEGLMKHTHSSAAVVFATLFLSAVAVHANSPSHITASVVSMDAARRTMVIVDSQGARRTVELDDQVGGFGNLKRGDRVLLTMQYDPGHARVVSIVRNGSTVAGSSAGSVVTAAPQPPVAAAPAARVTVAQDAAAEGAFAARVTVLASQASGVDPTWNSFRDSCEAKTTGDYSSGREWFALWDRNASSDLSGGFCRDLFNQIVGRGGDVVRGMAAAEESALAAGVLPGTIREIRKRNGLDWDGWSKPDPDRQPTP